MKHWRPIERPLPLLVISYNAAAGMVAQARTWLRKNQTAEAKGLLYPLILQGGQPGRYQVALLAEARFLLGLALAKVALAEQRLATLDETRARQPW